MKIDIKGPIISDGEQWIYDWMDMPATSPSKVNGLIAKMETGEDLEIEINSGGGSVFSGSEIYTALKSYKGNITGKIVGIAASAASVIAMGIKNLSISPVAQIMIHNASNYVAGNKNDMQQATTMLEGIDKSIANAYEIKTGMKQEDLLALMNKETWLTAQQAKEMGFVDNIMFEDEFKATASVGASGVIPQNIMNKIQNEFKNKLENKVKDANIGIVALELAKAQLELDRDITS